MQEQQVRDSVHIWIMAEFPSLLFRLKCKREGNIFLNPLRVESVSYINFISRVEEDISSRVCCSSLLFKAWVRMRGDTPSFRAYALAQTCWILITFGRYIFISWHKMYSTPTFKVNPWGMHSLLSTLFNYNPLLYTLKRDMFWVSIALSRPRIFRLFGFRDTKYLSIQIIQKIRYSCQLPVSYCEPITEHTKIL
jgi:hypothetical protein